MQSEMWYQNDTQKLKQFNLSMKQVGNIMNHQVNLDRVYETKLTAYVTHFVH